MAELVSGLVVTIQPKAFAKCWGQGHHKEAAFVDRRCLCITRYSKSCDEYWLKFSASTDHGPRKNSLILAFFSITPMGRRLKWRNFGMVRVRSFHLMPPPSTLATEKPRRVRHFNIHRTVLGTGHSMTAAYQSNHQCSL